MSKDFMEEEYNMNGDPITHKLFCVCIECINEDFSQ